MLKLSEVARYSTKRISADKVYLDNFVTTDNLLPNKGGITQPSSLPKSENAMPAFSKNQILIGNIRPYLKKIWFSNIDGGCSADVLVFEVNKNHTPKFIYYCLYRDDFFEHMMKGSKGTKMPRGDKSQILDFLIPNFELESQQKVAAVLSSLDAKIELNNRINAQLEAMAKTLYDYWFVQFDFPDANGKPYKTSGGKMVWNDNLKREIPDGWTVENLGLICNIYQPQTISEKEMVADGDYFVFGANGIVGRYDKFNHPESEIVITCRGASCGNIIRTTPEVWITGNAMVIHPLSEYICNEFIFQSLQWANVKEIITGSAQPQITRTNIAPLKILIPEIILLKKFTEFSKPVVNKKLATFKENQTLAELRDWLLPMLMNGQVTVK